MKKLVWALVALAAAAILIVLGYQAAKRSSAPKENGAAETLEDGQNVVIQTSAGENSVHCATGSQIALVSGESIRLFNRSGRETLTQNVSMNDPRAYARGDCVVAYDRGGKSLTVIRNGQTAYSAETDDPITCAKVNRNGYALTVTQGTLYKNAVAIYNSRGEEVFKWNSGGLYVVNGDLSDDNRTFAVATVDAGVVPVGSVVYLFNTEKDVTTSSVSLPETIVSAVVYSSRCYYCISDNDMTVLSAGGAQLGTVDYTDRQLERFAIDGGNAVLAFAGGEYGIQSRGVELETYNSRGERIGQAELDSDLKYLDCRDGTVCVGDGETVRLYNMKGTLRSNLDIRHSSIDFLLLEGASYGASFSGSDVEIIRLD